MEEGYLLGIDPEHKPLYSDRNFEAIIALMALLVIAPNIDMEKLKIGIEAIEKNEENSK